MLQHEIGLKSPIAEAPGLFGTRVRMVEFAAEGRKPVEKKDLIAFTVSAPRRFQADLKNPEHQGV